MPSMQEIEDFVAEVERNTARATERAHAWKSARIVEAIAGGLGRVVVDGYGVLHAVELDTGGLQFTDEQRLGPAVLDAIRRAERRAEEKRAAEHTSLR